jgi:hypothetical protein
MSKKHNKEKFQMDKESEKVEVKEQETAPATEPMKVVEETVSETVPVTEAKPEVKEEQPTPAPLTAPAEPSNDTKDVITPKSVSISQMASGNPRVRQFAYQCNQYIALHKTASVSEEDMTKKLAQFANIIRAIINTTDTEVYDAAYKFFKEHRNDILSEEKVFQYIHRLPTELSIRVQTVYTSFRELVAANMERRRFKLDYGLIRDNMKLPSQHPLLNWIRKRLNNR